jgi:hypothetical protein
MSEYDMNLPIHAQEQTYLLGFDFFLLMEDKSTSVSFVAYVCTPILEDKFGHGAKHCVTLP